MFFAATDMNAALATVYENFTFKNPTTTLPIIIWGIYFGFVIGGILSYYNKTYLGAVVRSLVKKGATSPETAVTFSQAGIKAGYFRRRAVFGDNALTKYVKTANPEECELEMREAYAFVRGLRRLFGREREKKFDAETAKFYVAEEKRIQAELRYSSKGSTLPVVVIGIVAAFAVAVLAINCIPYILELIDSVITMYKNL